MSKKLERLFEESLSNIFALVHFYIAFNANHPSATPLLALDNIAYDKIVSPESNTLNSVKLPKCSTNFQYCAWRLSNVKSLPWVSRTTVEMGEESS